MGKIEIPVSATESLHQVVARLQGLVDEGKDAVICPTCLGSCAIHRDTIGPWAAAWSLRLFRQFVRYKLNPVEDWIHCRSGRVAKGGATWQHAPAGGQQARLVLWGILQYRGELSVSAATVKRVQKGKTPEVYRGFYRFTEAGLDFVGLSATVPEYLFSYQNRILTFGGEDRDILYFLGHRYNYYDEMSYRAPHGWKPQKKPAKKKLQRVPLPSCVPAWPYPFDQPPAPSPPPPVLLLCPSCKAPNVQNAKFCNQCGNAMKPPKPPMLGVDIGARP